MKTKKISISFCENYIDIYQYLKTKPNISLFICQLVRSEMNSKNNSDSELENKIEQLINKVLKENNYSLDVNSQHTTSKNILNPLNEDIKSLIKDLF